MSDQPATPIELSQLIAGVRAELQKAREEGQGKPLQFKVRDIELELAVTTQQADKVKGGIKIYVLSGGAEESSARVHVHKIKLKLDPQLAEDPKKEFLASGEGVTPKSVDDDMPAGG